MSYLGLDPNELKICDSEAILIKGDPGPPGAPGIGEPGPQGERGLDGIGLPLQTSAEGILLFSDSSRSGKWLSLGRTSYPFSLNYKSIGSNRWLSSGGVPSNLNGYRIPRNATITSISVEASNSSSSRFYVRRNNSIINMSTVDLISERGRTVQNMNIDLLKDDILQVFLAYSTGINYPILNIELAWRL